MDFMSLGTFATRVGQCIRWINLVGRLTLWTVTMAAIASGLFWVLSALWLVVDLHGVPWFISIYKAVLGVALVSDGSAFLVLFVVHRLLVPPRSTHYRSLNGAKVHVALTAYNDEECIGTAVQEFKACPEFDKVIVIENNSKDATRRVAMEAGADEVITETIPGYGACCMRALAEAARGADVIVLCEGDLTFSARDIRKFLAYLDSIGKCIFSH